MVLLALITGASSGLGMALAVRIAKEKIPLFLTGTNTAALEKLQDELSLLTHVEILSADLSVEEERVRLLQEISQKAPDLVINSAGLGLYGEILRYPLKEQMQILKVNVEALTEITIESARALKAQNRPGVIMNISSAAAFLHYPSFALYSSSKAYVTHFSRSFDAEMKRYGIRVLVSCPGKIETSFRQRASSGLDIKKGDLQTMPVDKAASLIWRQIQKKKPCEIIDASYKVLIFIARFLIPKKILEKMLQQEIEKRISPKKMV